MQYLDQLLLMLNRASGNTLQVASGSFTGNGTSQSITGLGFKPDLVIIHDDSSTAGVRTSWKSASHVGDKTSSFVGSIANFANGIASLDSDGFSVGSANDVNENAKTLYWIAFKGTGTSFAFGKYGGNGTAQGINVGFQPNFVITKADSVSARGAWTTSANSTNDSMKFENSVNLSGSITSFTSSGFTVGSDATANASSTTYYWFAFKTSSTFAVGTYSTGASPSDNRSITGVGFQPIMVWIKANATENGALRMPGNVGDLSYPGFGGASSANNIQAMEADGFQLGTSNPVQKASTTFYYAAWKAPTVISTSVIRRMMTGMGS